MFLILLFIYLHIFQECESLNIHFHLLLGEAVEVLPKFVKENNIGSVVTDFCPLRVPRKWVSDVAEKLPSDVPFCQVNFNINFKKISKKSY